MKVDPETFFEISSLKSYKIIHDPKKQIDHPCIKPNQGQTDQPTKLKIVLTYAGLNIMEGQRKLLTLGQVLAIGSTSVVLSD